MASLGAILAARERAESPSKTPIIEVDDSPGKDDLIETPVASTLHSPLEGGGLSPPPHGASSLQVPHPSSNNQSGHSPARSTGHSAHGTTTMGGGSRASKASPMDVYNKQKSLLHNTIIRETLRIKDEQLIRAMQSHEHYARSRQNQLASLTEQLIVSRDTNQTLTSDNDECRQMIALLNKALMRLQLTPTSMSSSSDLHYALLHFVGQSDKRRALGESRGGGPEDGEAEDDDDEYEYIKPGKGSLRLHPIKRKKAKKKGGGGDASQLEQEITSLQHQVQFLQQDGDALRHALEMILSKAENDLHSKGRIAVDQLVKDARQDLASIKQLKEDPYLMALAEERKRQLQEMSHAERLIESLTRDKNLLERALRKAEQEVIQMRLKMMERDSSMAVVSKKVKSVELKLYEEQTTSGARIAAAEKLAGQVQERYETELKRLLEVQEKLDQHILNLKQEAAVEAEKFTAQLRAKDEYLDKATAQHKVEVDALTSKNKQLEADLDKVRRKMEDDIKRLREDNERAQGQLRNAQEQLGHTFEQLREERAKAAHAQDEMVHLNEELEKLRHQLSKQRNSEVASMQKARQRWEEEKEHMRRTMSVSAMSETLRTEASDEPSDDHDTTDGGDDTHDESDADGNTTARGGKRKNASGKRRSGKGRNGSNASSLANSTSSQPLDQSLSKSGRVRGRSKAGTASSDALGAEEPPFISVTLAQTQEAHDAESVSSTRRQSEAFNDRMAKRRAAREMAQSENSPSSEQDPHAHDDPHQTSADNHESRRASMDVQDEDPEDEAIAAIAVILRKIPEVKAIEAEEARIAAVLANAKKKSKKTAMVPDAASTLYGGAPVKRKGRADVEEPSEAPPLTRKEAMVRNGIRAIRGLLIAPPPEVATAATQCDVPTDSNSSSASEFEMTIGGDSFCAASVMNSTSGADHLGDSVSESPKAGSLNRRAAKSGTKKRRATTGLLASSNTQSSASRKPSATPARSKRTSRAGGLSPSINVPLDHYVRRHPSMDSVSDIGTEDNESLAGTLRRGRDSAVDAANSLNASATSPTNLAQSVGNTTNSKLLLEVIRDLRGEVDACKKELAVEKQKNAQCTTGSVVAPAGARPSQKGSLFKPSAASQQPEPSASTMVPLDTSAPLGEEATPFSDATEHDDTGAMDLSQEKTDVILNATTPVISTPESGPTAGAIPAPRVGGSSLRVTAYSDTVTKPVTVHCSVQTAISGDIQQGGGVGAAILSSLKPSQRRSSAGLYANAGATAAARSDQRSASQRLSASTRTTDTQATALPHDRSGAPLSASLSSSSRGDHHLNPLGGNDDTDPAPRRHGDVNVPPSNAMTANTAARHTSNEDYVPSAAITAPTATVTLVPLGPLGVHMGIQTDLLYPTPSTQRPPAVPAKTIGNSRRTQQTHLPPQQLPFNARNTTVKKDLSGGAALDAIDNDSQPQPNSVPDVAQMNRERSPPHSLLSSPRSGPRSPKQNQTSSLVLTGKRDELDECSASATFSDLSATPRPVLSHHSSSGAVTFSEFPFNDIPSAEAATRRPHQSRRVDGGVTRIPSRNNGGAMSPLAHVVIDSDEDVGSTNFLTVAAPVPTAAIMESLLADIDMFIDAEEVSNTSATELNDLSSVPAKDDENDEDVKNAVEATHEGQPAVQKNEATRRRRAVLAAAEHTHRAVIALQAEESWWHLCAHFRLFTLRAHMAPSVVAKATAVDAMVLASSAHLRGSNSTEVDDRRHTAHISRLYYGVGAFFRRAVESCLPTTAAAAYIQPVANSMATEAPRIVSPRSTHTRSRAQTQADTGVSDGANSAMNDLHSPVEVLTNASTDTKSAGKTAPPSVSDGPLHLLDATALIAAALGESDNEQVPSAAASTTSFARRQSRRRGQSVSSHTPSQDGTSATATAPAKHQSVVSVLAPEDGADTESGFPSSPEQERLIIVPRSSSIGGGGDGSAHSFSLSPPSGITVEPPPFLLSRSHGSAAELARSPSQSSVSPGSLSPANAAKAPFDPRRSRSVLALAAGRKKQDTEPFGSGSAMAQLLPAEVAKREDDLLKLVAAERAKLEKMKTALMLAVEKHNNTATRVGQLEETVRATQRTNEMMTAALLTAQRRAKGAEESDENLQKLESQQKQAILHSQLRFHEQEHQFNVQLQDMRGKVAAAQAAAKDAENSGRLEHVASKKVSQQMSDVLKLLSVLIHKCQDENLFDITKDVMAAVATERDVGGASATAAEDGPLGPVPEPVTSPHDNTIRPPRALPLLAPGREITAFEQVETKISALFSALSHRRRRFDAETADMDALHKATLTDQEQRWAQLFEAERTRFKDRLKKTKDQMRMRELQGSNLAKELLEGNMGTDTDGSLLPILKAENGKSGRVRRVTITGTDDSGPFTTARSPRSLLNSRGSDGDETIDSDSTDGEVDDGFENEIDAKSDWRAGGSLSAALDVLLKRLVRELERAPVATAPVASILDPNQTLLSQEQTDNQFQDALRGLSKEECNHAEPLLFEAVVLHVRSFFAAVRDEAVTEAFISAFPSEKLRVFGQAFETFATEGLRPILACSSREAAGTGQPSSPQSKRVVMDLHIKQLNRLVTAAGAVISEMQFWWETWFPRLSHTRALEHASRKGFSLREAATILQLINNKCGVTAQEGGAGGVAARGKLSASGANELNLRKTIQETDPMTNCAHMAVNDELFAAAQRRRRAFLLTIMSDSGRGAPPDALCSKAMNTSPPPTLMRGGTSDLVTPVRSPAAIDVTASDYDLLPPSVLVTHTGNLGVALGERLTGTLAVEKATFSRSLAPISNPPTTALQDSAPHHSGSGVLALSPQVRQSMALRRAKLPAVARAAAVPSASPTYQWQRGDKTQTSEEQPTEVLSSANDGTVGAPTNAQGGGPKRSFGAGIPLHFTGQSLFAHEKKNH